MTFRPSAPNKKRRWLALLAIVVLATGAIGVGTALAVPTFTFVADDQGANDEPGQKDLTAQAAAFEGTTFYTAWKWDDTSWSGKNTGDACSLFDSDGDGLVNYAVCVTIGAPAAEKSTRAYSCGDTRDDRCTNPIALIGTESVDGTADWCFVTQGVAGQFSGTDTQATCNVTQISTDLSVSALDGANLLNTCSYPSQEPNSDPSDCVITVQNTDVTVSTQSGGSITWTATLSDSATVSPSSATGTVTFKLYSDSSCTTLIWTSPAATISGGSASSGTTGGSPSGGNVITNATVNSDGKYYWIADYSPTGFFNGDSSACGELVTIVSTVTGSSGS